MMEVDQTKIVIATNDLGEALKIFFNKGVREEELTINYTNAFAGTVELLLRILREGAGWKEVDRGLTKAKNYKCRFNIKGYCSNPEKLVLEHSEKEPFKCVDSVRLKCTFYEQKNIREFDVNYVTVQLIGQVKSLRK